MIIACPYCKSNYKIKENLISKNGRKVKCYSCANFWIQFPDRKFIKLKSEDSFSTELAKRQNLIRNSLSKKSINILVISTSEIKISVLIRRENVKKAVAALHKEFKLDN